MAILNQAMRGKGVWLSLFALVLITAGCGGPREASRSGAPDAGGDNPTAETPDATQGEPAAGDVAAADIERSESAPPITEEIDGFEWTTSEPGRLGDPRAVPGGSMVTNIPNWPATLRIVGKASNTYLNSIVEVMCYERLLGFHPKTLEFIPGLATHWHVSEDKMTFRFRMNPEARWSDGKEVTAHDVVATYRLLMDKTLVDPMQRVTMGKMKEPKALSKYELEVVCKEKDWRNFIAISQLSILPAHEIEKLTGGEFLDKYNFTYPVGSGPYIVQDKDIKKGKAIALTRRKDYWALDTPSNKGLFNFNRVRFSVVRDNRLAFEKACKGEFDFYAVYTAKWWIEDVTPLKQTKLGHLIRQKIYTQHPEGVQGMAFNMRKPPLDDVRVRKAMTYLYDRKTMLKQFAYNEYTPSKSYFPNSAAENPDNQLMEFDPEAASQLLAEAGWTKRDSDGYLVKDGKRLTLTVLYRSQFFEKYLTRYQEACQSAGVELKPQLINPETHWTYMMDRKFELAGMAWGAVLFPSPKTNWSSAMADEIGSNNITGFKNEKADALIAQYDAEFDFAKRNEILRELDGVLFNEHPYRLDWYIPAQRVLYWNKFGTPEGGLPKYADWREVFTTWWIDPVKLKQLRASRKSGEAMTPIPPFEVKHWIENDSDATASNRSDLDDA